MPVNPLFNTPSYPSVTLPGVTKIIKELTKLLIIHKITISPPPNPLPPREGEYTLMTLLDSLPLVSDPDLIGSGDAGGLGWG